MKREQIFSAGVISFFTLLSRITGLIRDMVMAKILGSGASADAFYVAFRIPNMFRRFFGEGALTVSFIPVFVEALTKEGKERAKRFASSFFSLFCGILAIFSLLGVLTAHFQVKFFAPGFRGEKFLLTSELLRITFPYIFLISTAALLTGILNSLKHFSSPAFSPVLLNLSMIILALLWGSRVREPSIPVAWSVLVGGMLQILIQIPFLIKKDFAPYFTKNINDRYSFEVGRLMIISIFSAGIYQINLVVITMFSSLLQEGSVSYLYYAGRFLEFPLGLLIFPVTSVILPELSRFISKGEREAAVKATRDALEMSLVLTFPASVGLCILSEEIITLFLRWGRFTLLDVLHTSTALIAYTIGLIPVAFSRVLNQFFYSEKDFKSPAIYAFYVLLINIALCFLLSPLLHHNGLALATSISSLFNVFLLLHGLGKRNLQVFPRLKEILKVVLSGLLMACFLFLLKEISPQPRGKIEIALFLFAAIASCGALYLFFVYILRVESIRIIIKPYSRT